MCVSQHRYKCLCPSIADHQPQSDEEARKMATTALDFLSSSSVLDRDTYRLGTTKVWSTASMQAFIGIYVVYVLTMDLMQYDYVVMLVPLVADCKFRHNYVTYVISVELTSGTNILHKIQCLYKPQVVDNTLCNMSPL